MLVVSPILLPKRELTMHRLTGTHSTGLQGIGLVRPVVGCVVTLHVRENVDVVRADEEDGGRGPLHIYDAHAIVAHTWRR
jgi:hypothetical protein